MAIDHTTFSYWWALWCEKWNRKPSPAFVREFHQAVDWLDTDEFETAARALWQGPGFFPSVADVLEKARPADSNAVLRLEASKAFDEIHLLADYGPHGATWRPAAIEGKLGPVALQAFGVAGGAARFRWMTEQDEHWVRKAFCDAYVDLAAEYQRTERLALTSPKRPAISGPMIRSPRLEHIGKVLPMLPAGNPKGNGTDGNQH